MTSPSIPSLTWLHLSDFHLQERHGWAQDVVLDSMLQDILTRYSGSLRPDLLFLTGDIAYGGTKAQYDLAEEFVRRLCTGMSLPLDRVFIVPGNHDIDRGLSEDAFVGARSRLNSPADVDGFFGNSNRREILFARQAEFRAFANRLSPHAVYTAASYAHVRRVDVGALRVRVLLLDSAWLAQGGETDAGQLLVGERQVLDCTKGGSPDPGCITFALMHHPISALREFEQVAIENLLMETADLCLRGHVHATDIRSATGSRGQITTFTAGAAFQSRTTQNTYSWCAMHLEDGRGEQVIHRYNHAQRNWETSQPQPWQIASQPPAPGDIRAVHQLLVDCGVSHPCYVSCLISDIQADVPMRLIGETIAFVRFDAPLPGYENKVGTTVGKLRRHFVWRHAFDETWWLQRLREIVAALQGELAAVAGQTSELDRREEVCAKLVGVQHSLTQVVAPACVEVRELLAAGALESARAVIERWMPQDFLNAAERREMRRLEVFLLLEEGQAALALEKAATLAAEPEGSADDFALTATCALNSGEHQRAARLLHEALDLGLPAERARTTALRIAGVTGDRRLVERVSQ